MHQWLKASPWPPDAQNKISASLFQLFSHLTSSCVPPPQACCSDALQHTKLTPASAMQILHTSSAPFPGCLPAPQQEASAEQGPQNGALSWGTLTSPWNKLHPEAPGAGEEGATRPVHQHGQLLPGTTTALGGGNTNSFVPKHSRTPLCSVPEVTFDHSPPAKKLFLACFLPRVLAALHLLRALVF